MKSVNLKLLSVDNLITLRDQIVTVLEGRVDRERRDLEARLKRLQQYKSGSEKHKGGKSIVAAPTKPSKKSNTKPIKKVAPKFRNPENSSETWTGRGLQPRWMRSAIDGGKSIEDFRI